MTVRGKPWCLDILCGLDISTYIFSGVLKPKEFITMYEKFFPANDANTFAEVTAMKIRIFSNHQKPSIKLDTSLECVPKFRRRQERKHWLHGVHDRHWRDLVRDSQGETHVGFQVIFIHFVSTQKHNELELEVLGKSVRRYK